MRDWYLYTYDKAALASRQVGGNAHVASAGNSVRKTTANWVGACVCVRVFVCACVKLGTVKGRYCTTRGSEVTSKLLPFASCSVGSSAM